MAFVLSSSIFTRVLVIICIIRGVMASGDFKTTHYLYPREFTFQCSSSYVINTIESQSCEMDTSLQTKYICTQHDGRVIQFIVVKNMTYRRLCRQELLGYQGPCDNTTNDGDIKCEDMGTKRKFTCYFNASKEYEGLQIFCRYYCRLEDKYWGLLTNSTCHLNKEAPTTAVLTTTAAPTAAAPTTAAPPEKEFPIWAAVVIALGIAGLIALLLFLVWRKRRQAQGPVQDPEGGNTGNPEGEEAEGGEDDAEEEEATNTESAEKSEDAQGGEEAPEEE